MLAGYPLTQQVKNDRRHAKDILLLIGLMKNHDRLPTAIREMVDRYLPALKADSDLLLDDDIRDELVRCRRGTAYSGSIRRARLKWRKRQPTEVAPWMTDKSLLPKKPPGQ